MQELDIAQFWRDDEAAHANNCFNQSVQIPLGIRMSDECVFAELGEEGTPWMPIARERRIELNRRYNDKSERMVGKRLLKEDFLPEDARLPDVKRIGEVFGGSYIYHNETEWLTQSVHSNQQLERLLDQVEKMDLRAFMLPENWEAEKKRVYERYGVKPALYRGLFGRGFADGAHRKRAVQQLKDRAAFRHWHQRRDCPLAQGPTLLRGGCRRPCL